MTSLARKMFVAIQLWIRSYSLTIIGKKTFQIFSIETFQTKQMLRGSHQFIKISALDINISIKMRGRSKWFAILYSAKRLEIMEIAQFF